MTERTPEERERARREREARRQGRELPPEPTPKAEKPKRAKTPKPSAVELTQPQTPQDQPGSTHQPPPQAVQGQAQAADPGQQQTAQQGQARPTQKGQARTAQPGRRRPVPPQPKSTRPRRGIGRRIALVAGLICVILILWFVFALFQPFKGEGHGRIRVNIPAGSSAQQIGDRLASKGVISSGLLFSFRATMSGKLNDLKPGKYILKEDMSYAAAIKELSRGPHPAFVTVTIPEGLSRNEIVPVVKKARLDGDYLKETERSRYLNPRDYGAPRGTPNLEGFLFPATYQLSGSSSVKSLIKQQLRAFKQRFATVNLKQAKKKNLTGYDVIIIASMIEREAQVDADRRKIAAVIYNRLHKGIPLGIDATTRFEKNNWTKPLTSSDLSSNSRYNTRKHHGLTPTPIGNPGLASLKAAANPAKVGYLYYVAKPGTCGKHAFSSTYDKFQQDVKRYQQARAENDGNSPDTCD